VDESLPEGTTAAPQKGTVTQRAIDQIKAMIGEGRLEPGAAAADRARSRVPAGHLAQLDARGDPGAHGPGRPGGPARFGIYVTQLEAGDLLETFGVVADLSRGPGLVELLEVRRILESTATALAAARITPDQLAEVEKHFTAMNATDDPEEILAHDLAFHREIGVAAGNDTMAAILEGLSSRTFRARVWRGYQEEGAFERTRREHAAIHRALVARDPEAARAAAAAHVGEVEEWLRTQLQP
jgi:GntR family transcriptional repressor for pyruvate dehydrogenase complex